MSKVLRKTFMHGRKKKCVKVNPIYNMYSTCSVFHVFNDSSIKSFGHDLGVFRSDRLVKGN